MSEQRRSRRSAIELAASFGIGDDPRPQREVKIDNISSGGFCFIAKQRLRPGQHLDVAVDLDLHDQVIVPVKVMWTQKMGKAGQYRIGVQIVESKDPNFARFLEFYNKQL